MNILKYCWRPQMRHLLSGVLILLSGALPATVLQAAEPAAKVLIVVGPSSHPPGTHEVAAGARVMQHCLQHPANTIPLEVVLRDSWPTEPADLADVASVIFIGDLFPPERMQHPQQVKDQLGQMMKRGCGLVCVHYATGLRKEHVAPDGDHPLLNWLGGYFASGCPHHQSVARIVTATVEPETSTAHAILRGWKKFTFDDEPYWSNYFGADGMRDDVVSLAFAMLPPESPQKETIAWATQRQDGGRGVGIVMPHYFRNWQLDDLRTMILNSIYWSANQEIPPEGVRAELPDLAQFKPSAVAPTPAKKSGQP